MQCTFIHGKKGLKTGIYYLRSQAKTSAQKFSVDLSKVGSGSGSGSNDIINSKNEIKNETKKESMKEPTEEQECLMCSS